MKTPPQQYTDSEARRLTEKFIKKFGQKVNQKKARPKRGQRKK
jgi:hypothetical protein